MKRTYLYFLLFAFSLGGAVAHDHRSDHSAFRFIENKNQWDSRVLFKSDIPGGAVFLEKNVFTYHLIDESIRQKLHLGKDSVNFDTLTVRGHAFKVNFPGANPSSLISGEHVFPDYYNYFIGNNPDRWASKVFAYEAVNYKEIYSGIDLKIYSSAGNLKYDFIVLPGADVTSIKLHYEGLDKIFLSEGNLILKTSIVDVIEEKPYAYQIINGKKITVPCHYVLDGNILSYAFPRGYDKSQKLIIDPTLIFSTYSGSRSDNFGYTATFDSEGFLYSGSTAFSTLYPVTPGAYQATFAGGSEFFFGIIGTDIAITKFDTSGTFRIYSTYIGGSEDEQPHSLIANSRDELFILSTTGSANFPVSSDAYDNTFNGGTAQAISGTAVYFPFGSDLAISKLNPEGTVLLASTYLGGTANDGLNVSSSLRYNYADEIRGEIEIDNSDNVYIASCTRSSDFPMAGSGFQQIFGGGILDAVIVKMRDDLTGIVWSSYLGGISSDASYSLEVDTLQNFYITGGTNSSNFPTTSGVITPLQQGGLADGFISYVDQNGDSIIYSTYFGSAFYDQIYFVDLDKFNNVYIFGQTEAPGATFIQNAGFSQPNSGQVLTKLTPELDSIIWSTVFGTGSGVPNISPTAFVVDLCSKIYLSGWGGTPKATEFISSPQITRPFNMFTTLGPNPPTDFYDPTTTGHDFYLFVLEDDASAVHYASFFGGGTSKEHVDGGTSRFDKKGKIYQAMCAGCAACTFCPPNSDMPVQPSFGNALLPDSNRSFNCNLGVFKMDFRLPTVVADFDAEPGCIGDTIFFVNKSLIKSQTKYQWKFGDGGTSTAKDPFHIYAAGGTYNVTLILSDSATCNLADTLTKTLYISPITSIALTAYADQDTIYRGQSTTLHVLPSSGFTFSWVPSESLNNSTIPDPIAKPDTTTTYTVFASDPLLAKCGVEAKVTVVVIEANCEERTYIPNAFTPNGDNQNDILYVRSPVIKDFFFTIYNRWGEKVFETSDLSIGWDGTYKGMEADPGVFVYYLEATCVDDTKFFKKGNITLIR